MGMSGYLNARGFHCSIDPNGLLTAKSQHPLLAIPNFARKSPKHGKKPSIYLFLSMSSKCNRCKLNFTTVLRQLHFATSRKQFDLATYV